MKDFIYEVEPGVNGKLRLIVNKLDETGRDKPELDKPAIDSLRSGEPDAALAKQLIVKLSEWLFAKDEARIRLKDALNAQEALRLIIKVNPDLLDAVLADVPFELIHLEAQPLVLDKRVRSIVHYLPKITSVPIAPPKRDWPLRILIVRSNPVGLGGAVPTVIDLKNEIIKTSEDEFGKGFVEVKVISRESGIDKPATWDALRGELEGGSPPHILTYLGHADLAAGPPGSMPSGRLQLESADGSRGIPIAASKLNDELQNFPVPVVILAGCYTAAQLANKAVIDPLVPDWMRAHQGIAQALINSGSAVEVAIGMRYRLETSDATKFLTKFFRTLLEPPAGANPDVRGSVEEAVRAARFELNQHTAAMPFSYSAPAVFRTPTSSEPMFAFLRTSPHVIDEEERAAQRSREAIWNDLCKIPLAGRSAALALFEGIYKIADGEQVRRSLGKNVPMLTVRQNDEQNTARTYGQCAPKDAAKVVVELRGAVTVVSISGAVRVEDPELKIANARGTKALKNAGFSTLFESIEDDDPNILRFRLQAKTADQAGFPLPEGPLFTFDVSVDDEFPKVHVITVEIDEVKEPTPLRGGSNGILVAP